MQFLIGLLGAMVGALATGTSAFFTTRAQMRRDLVYNYDKDLRARRITAYATLYKLTGNMPRYWTTNPPRDALLGWADEFDKWYFGESGGLFLSNNARAAYLSLLELAASVSDGESEEPQLTDEEI